MRNWELKCRCGDLEGVRSRAFALGARDVGVLEQVDTFFPAPEGRVKLREFGEGGGELIAYRRPDGTEARGSDYLLYQVPEPERLREVLAFALGTRAVVRKRRRLLLWRHTRIHLDQVEGLGAFVELETVMTGQTDAEARAELEQVAAALGLDACELVSQAYVDLLEEQQGGR
jgi:predicted adenylyl cyclase CyaB